jgi:uncharacterized membrane protein YkvA (DUF1232 family)
VGTHGPGGPAEVAGLSKLRAWALALRRDAHAVWLAARDPRTPWIAKAVALAVAAYAFSPIDLIPDFVPVLGYLDDLILVPAGLWLALKLVPPEVLAEHRAAAEAAARRPVSRAAAVAVVLAWVAFAAAAALAILRTVR